MRQTINQKRAFCLTAIRRTDRSSMIANHRPISFSQADLHTDNDSLKKWLQTIMKKSKQERAQFLSLITAQNKLFNMSLDQTVILIFQIGLEQQQNLVDLYINLIFQWLENINLLNWSAFCKSLLIRNVIRVCRRNILQLSRIVINHFHIRLIDLLVQTDDEELKCTVLKLLGMIFYWDQKLTQTVLVDCPDLLTQLSVVSRYKSCLLYQLFCLSNLFCYHSVIPLLPEVDQLLALSSLGPKYQRQICVIILNKVITLHQQQLAASMSEYSIEYLQQALKEGWFQKKVIIACLTKLVKAGFHVSRIQTQGLSEDQEQLALAMEESRQWSAESLN